jgi:molecular chaperone IbpA
MLHDPFFSDFYAQNSTYARTASYNVIKLSESKFCVEINVAGIDESDITIEMLKNKLTVSSKVNLKDDRDYMFNGISRTEFKNTFSIVENVEVQDAKVKNGILTINMEVIIPEEKKPRKIAITH